MGRVRNLSGRRPPAEAELWGGEGGGGGIWRQVTKLVYSLSAPCPDSLALLSPSFKSPLTAKMILCSDGSHPSLHIIAEEVGFEPTIRSPVCRFSRPVPSTTQPLLQNILRIFAYGRSGFGLSSCGVKRKQILFTPLRHSSNTRHCSQQSYKEASTDMLHFIYGTRRSTSLMGNT